MSDDNFTDVNLILIKIYLFVIYFTLIFGIFYLIIKDRKQEISSVVK